MLRNLVNRANDALVQSVSCSLDEAFGSMTRTNWAAFSQDGASERASLAVGQNQWDPILVGRCTTHFRTYFSGDWDVHWGTI